MKLTAKLWIGILLLAVISPLGLLLPEYLSSGSAWGEWSVKEIEKLIGFIPEGFAKLSELWKAPVPDYSLESHPGKGLLHLSLSYIISAFIGIAVIVIIVFLIGKKLTKKGD